MKTTVVLALAVLAQAIGNTCLSKGMKILAASSSGVEEIVTPMILWRAMETPMIWVGTFCLILFFALFAGALTWADLSFVLPVSSFGYILNVAFARLFLAEPVSALRWAGTGFIIFGVFLVSRSTKSSRGKGTSAEKVLEGAGKC